MKKTIFSLLLLLFTHKSFCWGFYAHEKINYLSVFLLPPEMIGFYKKHIAYIREHATDPDKRRYAVNDEAPRHFIDINHYGSHPFPSLPRLYDSAVAKYSKDTITTYGIVPWWIQIMKARLVKAFKEKNAARILQLSAEIGHYIGDAHVPLHASKNHNGQYTNQHGIHGFWESRIPELLAEKEFDFWIGKADYIAKPLDYMWERVIESAAAADTVLIFEQQLSSRFPADQKFTFEARNGKILRQYSSAYSRSYNDLLGGMVERRMRQSIYAIASFWYTAWVDAGQPDLSRLTQHPFTEVEKIQIDSLEKQWRMGKIRGRTCE
jgi:hypothetical protein